MKLIAETAWHHDGDFNFFSTLIDRIISSSADVVKIHVLLDLEKYMDQSHAAFDFLKDRTFDKNQWSEILSKIKKSNKELMALINDTDALDLVSEYSPSLVEVHSVALNNHELLRKIDQKFSDQTKIVLGVGGSTLYEIENAASQFKNKPIVLMFGFQNYPTKYQDVNFNKIRRIMRAFPECEFGYADHTAWNLKENALITLMGAALGMGYIEKHVTTHFGEERTDWSAAINFETLEEIKSGMQILEECNGDGLLHLNSGEQSYCQPGLMKQIGIASVDMQVGETFELTKVQFLRSGLKNGMSQLDLWTKDGHILKRNISTGQALTNSHFSENDE